LGDPYCSSVGNTTFAPYTMKKGVKLVDLLGMVRMLQCSEGDLDHPSPSSGSELGLYVLTFLGEDVRLQALQYHAVSTLDLPIRTWVGNHSPVHTYVIVITEIQELFSGELSLVVSDDGIRNPETENDVLDEGHNLLGTNFSQGLHLNPLSELLDYDEQVGQVHGCLLEGSKKIQAHTVKGKVMVIV
jgi:hypothetical protein